MYIDNVAACETGYIPNNPLFGLQLESEPQDCPSTVCVGCNSCQGSLPLSLHGSDFGNCLDHSLSQSNTHTNLNSFWNDEMTSFSGLEIEPLPSLFQFSPGYNRLERPINHDGCAADVLLSLKHAVVKGDSPPLCHQPNVSGYNNNPNSASLSYTVHPQMLLSPTSAAHHFYHHQNQSQNSSYGSSSYYEGSQCPPHHSMMYPSMSVNVSMNMTVEPLPNYRNPKREAIHGLNYASNADGPMHCQWNPPPSPAVNVLYPPLLSPTYPSSATYSFTADFRPTNGGSNLNLTNGNNSAAQNVPSTMEMINRSTPSPLLASAQKSYYQSSICYSTPKASPTYNTTPKLETTKIPSETGYEYEEDSNSVDGLDSKPNLCRLCGKTYARPSTLKTHLRTHSGERPYRCPDCNKSFSQAANLTAHVRTHTGQKPFRCQICDRRFSQSSSVTTHMRTHSGERPYRCKACKKAFSDSSTLTKHLRIHSGDKPYQCKLCLLRFSQSGNLNRHMRVHGNTGNLIT